ncbi:hypothetical protein ACH5RR_012594 [Cinchona calisaya]|uniref:HTH OST-type domain-containing protein n=1 Tax=Cinchona calisaya TaxID=153742 RepID=A0ABD3A8Q9_9GENT
MIRVKFSAKPISKLTFFTTKNSANTPKFLFHIVHFSTFSPNPSPNTTPYPSRRHEEESRNVRVSVWWDFENCNLRAGANVFRVAQCITAAIRANGIKGPIQITAFGDVMQLSRLNQEALSSTGINLTHIPRGGKNSADRSLLVDLMYWVSQNPPPAHLFLISADRDFAGILHRLRMNNYNILLASSESAPSVLCSAASIMWHWASLLKGENLSGKHFNQPPDGPYGSWYGHYRAPLEDPFAVTEQPACPQAPLTEQLACPGAEDLPDSVRENKIQPIPKTIIKQMHHILCQYPNGISITDLRAELSKSNLSIDKNFYGHKKFSRFLLAMPNILKLKSRSDGQFFVRGVSPKIPEQADLSPSPSITTGQVHNGEMGSIATAKQNGGKGSCNDQLVQKSSLPQTSETLMKGKLQDVSTSIQKPPRVQPVPPSTKPKAKSASQEATTEVQEPPKEVQDSPTFGQADNTKATESQLLHLVEHSPESELGLFKMIWGKWFRVKDNTPEVKISSASDLILDEKMTTNREDARTNSHSISGNEEISDVNISRSFEATDDRSKKGSGFFSQILSKLKFWGSSVQSDDSSEESSEKINQSELCDINEIFAKESFWDDLKMFLDTPKVSATVTQSRTRMQMGEDLQKQGPPVLKSLSKPDLLHLVDLMIAEKKWIEESTSQTYPFKIVHADEKDSSSQTSTSCQSNGLSSIFSNTETPSLSQRLRELDAEKRHQSPHSGLSQLAIEGIPSGKSRSEILADCQKLLDEIVKKYPDGFNMGSFRKLFCSRYGYSLDIQKLGYRKLATLLQIMPGVRIESTYILPAGEVLKSLSLDTVEPIVWDSNFGGTETQSESELSDASGQEDDVDSPWDELGPVANSGHKKNERGAALNRKRKNETGEKIHHDYESLSDDDFSDLEEEISSSMISENKKKPIVNKEDSSLLEILDLWYSGKEDNKKRGYLENLDGGADFSKNGSRVSTSAGSITKTEASVVNNARKQRPLKSYSFVQDEAVENKEKMIDGILSSLKKSGERSAETRI